MVFESSIAGNYDVQILGKQKFEIILVGGGSGGAKASFYLSQGRGIGGSGAMISGITMLAEQTYSLSIGKGGASGYTGGTSDVYSEAGGDTAGFQLIAGGGQPAIAGAYPLGSRSTNGLGGVATAPDNWTKVDGKSGDVNGVYINQYGAGGEAEGPSNGHDGYIKITAV